MGLNKYFAHDESVFVAKQSGVSFSKTPLSSGLLNKFVKVNNNKIV
jgi:hypothetical protein